MNEAEALERAARLACWQESVAPEPLAGGITNRNFLVRHRGERFFVRVGHDIPAHLISRANELTASRAAAAAGLSPKVVHCEAGALVMPFIEGRTLTPEIARAQPMLSRILPLIQQCHYDVMPRLRGPVQMFWLPFLLRHYAAELADGTSIFMPHVPRLISISDELHAVIGPIEIVFSHNDLLAANIIDDGARLWLIDWDYAGFNSPLFDLANLSSNNELAPSEEAWLLDTYFEKPRSAELERRYSAMKCASLLREAMWGMVSDLHSTLDVDYIAYARGNLERFERALVDFRQY